MTTLNTNFATSYEVNASATSDGSSYRLVESGASRRMGKTILLMTKPAGSNETQLETVDALEAGYALLAGDESEKNIATQRRINRGKVPGRRIAD